jgi:hypothetical protein
MLDQNCLMRFPRIWEIVVVIEGGLAIGLVDDRHDSGRQWKESVRSVMRPPRANQRAKSYIRRLDLLSLLRAVPSLTISTYHRLTTTAFGLATSSLEGSIRH